MLLVKMEDYSSVFPPLCVEDVFPLIDSYDNGLYGRKKKKKPSLVMAECRLDSPCNSPEVIMSGGMEDGTKRGTSLIQSDSSPDEPDSVEHGNMFGGGSMFGGVDMEAFYEISATLTAGEDIMLSSSAKEGKMLLKEVATKHDLLKLPKDNVCSASHNSSSASIIGGLQSAFESDVDVLLENSLWQNRQVGLSAPDLPDLSGLAVSGYLLSDIPSHPDLSCEASESVDSLLSYCSDKDECLSSSSPNTEHNKEELISSIKCEEGISSQNQCDAIYSDFDSLCTSTLLNMQSGLNDCPRVLSCGCPGRDCLCYKSDVSSTEEEDACIEYIVSHHRPSKLRRTKRKGPAHLRRGPGRPRKLQNTDFIRRGPGRPRKKSVSDAVVWYQTRRKRTVSLSNGYKSRNRQKSTSDDTDAQRVHIPVNVADKTVKPKHSRRGDSLVQLSDGQLSFDAQRLPSVQSIETGINMLC